MSNEDAVVHEINWKKLRSDKTIMVGFVVLIAIYVGLLLCLAIEYFFGLRVYRPILGVLFFVAFVGVVSLASYSVENYLLKKK
ncbi:fatty acid desaturase [Xanthomonas arboricola]|nr:fatty acid desaturase [Xanthomonas cannabis]